jgi:hypothetical protein
MTDTLAREIEALVAKWREEAVLRKGNPGQAITGDISSYGHFRYGEALSQCAGEVETALAVLGRRSPQPEEKLLAHLSQILDQPVRSITEGIAMLELEVLAEHDRALEAEKKLAASQPEGWQPMEADYRAFADRLWYRWQAISFGARTDRTTWDVAVEMELKDMLPVAPSGDPGGGGEK